MSPGFESRLGFVSPGDESRDLYVYGNNDENEDPYTAVPKRMNMNPLIDMLPELPI